MGGAKEIKDTWIEKFDVCYDISPNGVSQSRYEGW